MEFENKQINIIIIWLMLLALLGIASIFLLILLDWTAAFLWVNNKFFSWLGDFFKILFNPLFGFYEAFNEALKPMFPVVLLLVIWDILCWILIVYWSLPHLGHNPIVKIKEKEGD
ncbi:MAG: hypothetical protein ACFFCI_00665 [Promethearchaeota archaeon]